MIPELVSLEMVKGRLKLPLDVTAQDEDLQLMIDQATVQVLEFVDQRVSDADAWSETVAAWTDETVPAQVQAAILNLVAYMNRFRGDDVQQDAPKLEHGYLPPSVTMWLFRLKDPALGAARIT